MLLYSCSEQLYDCKLRQDSGMVMSNSYASIEKKYIIKLSSTILKQCVTYSLKLRRSPVNDYEDFLQVNPVLQWILEYIDYIFVDIV